MSHWCPAQGDLVKTQSNYTTHLSQTFSSSYFTPSENLCWNGAPMELPHHLLLPSLERGN
jgi:hypothetical protein